MVVALQAVPPNAVTNILPALGFFLAWTTLYFTLCLINPRRSYEWHGRSVTAVHAILVCFMSGWSAFILGPWPFTDPGGPITRMEYVTCNVCLGYFLFDFAWCLFFQTEGLVMVLHHMLSILGNAAIIYWALSGTEMIATIFGSELTNPLLQLRWFLREKDRHKTWFGEVNDVVFMLLFCYLRVGVGTSLLYWVLHHPNPCLLVKLGGALHYILGWAFFVQIIRYGIRKYTKMYKQSRKNAQQRKGEVVMNGDQSVTSHADQRNRMEKEPSEASVSSGNGVVRRKNVDK